MYIRCIRKGGFLRKAWYENDHCKRKGEDSTMRKLKKI